MLWGHPAYKEKSDCVCTSVLLVIKVGVENYQLAITIDFAENNIISIPVESAWITISGESKPLPQRIVDRICKSVL